MRSSIRSSEDPTLLIVADTGAPVSRETSVLQNFPLAIGITIDHTLAKTERLYMVVETEGRFTTGMSLADLCDRRDEESNPPNIDVCLDVDIEGFWRMFDELLWQLTQV